MTLEYVQNVPDDDDGNLRYIKPEEAQVAPAIREALRQQCDDQRIRSSGQVQSFSVLGLFMVVSVTAITGVVALSLESCVAFLRRHTMSNRDTALQADDSLHLLRQALGSETSGGEPDRAWEDSRWSVPTCNVDYVVRRPIMGINRLSNYGTGSRHGEVLSSDR